MLGVISIESFESGGHFYSETKPDFAFAHIDDKDVPFLEICGDSNTIEAGVDVATICFPQGDVSLMPFSETKASHEPVRALRNHQ